ncbi:DUF4139 domain-containing protein [Sphingomonas rubra]|uniref:DUF4139 domain-containing protein n=1 Tax=Sphingomonas rubra TaxID=634430 RepID=A0A1I5TTA5_9SPHN|nr:hypothetical protein [Sphingomonas rubra]SFP86300.1 hypothetical protein SAMN04488241_10940 [Sphingomonas rubra]
MPAALLRAALLIVAAAATPAAAQPRVVTSPAPQRVALTVYRAPYGRGAIDLNDLRGFALVTETRRIAVPRGPATLRFEGVAAGIVPVSAVVDGLPGGVVEKNRDARLLSPASLIDGTLGRQVTLTRTDRATGRRTSEEATIVAGPASGVVLRTATGIEALRCAGLPERLSFRGVPAGLSSKPVLSVAVDSPVARTVTVRLSYLASGFDWRASYVATIAADARSLDLFAWLTLANGNAEAFADAEVAAVAGRLNRIATPDFRVPAAPLSLTCYPLGTTTSDLREQVYEEPGSIVLTGSRVANAMFAPPPPLPPPPPPAPPPPPEDVGDLKLYRVPEPVTVRARGQKQVALLARTTVPFERRYRRPLYPGQTATPSPTPVVLVLRNRKEEGLGLALPSGSTATYARRGEERLLLGLGTLDDRAEGETFRIAVGTSPQILVEQTLPARNEALIQATNGSRLPATIDVPIGAAGQKIESDDPDLRRVDGVATWSIVLQPGDRASLRYRY